MLCAALLTVISATPDANTIGRIGGDQRSRFPGNGRSPAVQIKLQTPSVCRAQLTHGVAAVNVAASQRFYYVCPNNVRNPHGARKCPDHVGAAIREDVITATIAGFLDDFVLGYDRAAMLQRLLPFPRPARRHGVTPGRPSCASVWPVMRHPRRG
jgi:hypothetical protein